MIEPIDDTHASTEDGETSGVSRRGMILGLGAAAGAVAGAGLISTEAAATSAVPRISTSLRPEAVSPPIPGLTYIAIDAQQMWPTVASTRVYQDITGTQGPPNDRIWAGLPLPVGSVIKQISVGYQTQPILEISRRPITPAIPAVAPAQVFQKTLTMSPGQGFSSTELITPNVTIEQDFSYMLSFFLGPGSSVFNASIGYTPPAAPPQQAFFPFTGSTPRVLDTRDPGPLSGKLLANEERTVDLGITGARTAVINLTVTQTGGAGYVAAFPANITWPGNSSVNWYEPNSDLANGVVVALDPTGKIKIRGGGGANTHVVIDRIGYFL